MVSLHLISTQQGASYAGERARARNQLFFSKKFVYSSSNSLFPLLLAFMMHHTHDRTTNHPLNSLSETIYVISQPTVIVCLIHVRIFVLPRIILHRLLVIRVGVFN